MGREFTYLSSHATNRYFIPNWGKEYKGKILKTGLEGFLIGVAIGVAAGIVYFFK